MLLRNCMDFSKLISAERRQIGTSERLKVLCPAMIKEYNSHLNGLDIHDELKTSYKIDRKSRFRYYLRIFFKFMDSIIFNARVIYKKKVNAKTSLPNFKIILAELLINRFSSQKRKITAEEPQLTVELPQPLKEPDEIVHFAEKRQRSQYCFTNEQKDVKCFTYCKYCNISLCA